MPGITLTSEIQTIIDEELAVMRKNLKTKLGTEWNEASAIKKDREASVIEKYRDVIIQNEASEARNWERGEDRQSLRRSKPGIPFETLSSNVHSRSSCLTVDSSTPSSNVSPIFLSSSVGNDHHHTPVNPEHPLLNPFSVPPPASIRHSSTTGIDFTASAPSNFNDASFSPLVAPRPSHVIQDILLSRTDDGAQMNGAPQYFGKPAHEHTSLPPLAFYGTRTYRDKPAYIPYPTPPWPTPPPSSNQTKLPPGGKPSSGRTVLSPLSLELVQHQAIDPLKCKPPESQLSKESEYANSELACESKRGSLFDIRDVDRHFFIDDAVAAGSFTDIYRINIDGAAICVKVIRAHQQPSPEVMDKVYARAKAWAQLSHPNILNPLYTSEIFVSRSRISFVSPWAENGNISDYLARNPTVNRILLCLDIAYGLEYLHENNIVYGSIQPTNIVVDNHGRAHLDFVLSRDAQGRSMRWSAPELHDETPRAPSKKSDIFAWANVCYQILTGRLPYFEIFRESAVMMRIIHGGTPTRPAEDDLAWKRGLDEHVWSLLQDCWKFNPMERPDMTSAISRININSSLRPVGER